MLRSIGHFSLLVIASLAYVRAAQGPAAQAAAIAIQRGDAAGAETILRTELRTHPDDPWTLSLLGVALDHEKRMAEAEDFHRKAVAAAPHSAEILNNYGSHQWMEGEFSKAEATFSDALAAAPGYFNVLFNLGMMASQDGHYRRAQTVFEAALKQQPDNVNVLYSLAFVEEATQQWEKAAMRLAQAAKLDPRRPDVQRLLAVTTMELGALDDSAAAWDRFLQLVPGDEAGRRERGYVAARMGKLQQGIADLEWYAARHPEDAVGHYELGQAERSLDMAKAIAEFDKAIAIDAEFTAARAARGGLYYQEGKAELALPDLEAAVAKQPGDAATLDRLGQTYQALDRTADAVRVLRRAVALQPSNSAAVLHLGRALADAGNAAESKTMMERFQQLGPEENKGVPAGLVDFLSMTPEQRRADYRARAQKAAREHPEDAAAALAYLRLLVEEHNAAASAAEAKRLIAMKAPAAALGAAGLALLGGKYYAPARELLQAAAAGPQAPAGVRLGLAVAVFHLAGAKAGLEAIDRLPQTEGSADFYLNRAEMLAAAGRLAETAPSVDTGLKQAGDRLDLYRQALQLAAKWKRPEDAVRWTEMGVRALPESADALLLQAAALEFAGRSADAARVFSGVENRWPEASAAWMEHGIALAARGHCEEARPKLDAAVALGARTAETYYYVAACALAAKPPVKSAAEAAIQQAIAAAPGDPWVQSLGGRIAVENGDSKLAATRQQAAARLRPGLAKSGAALSEAPPYLMRLFEGKLVAEQ